MSTYSFTGDKVSFTYQRLLQISDGGDGNPTGIIYDGFGATVTIANENINNLYTTVQGLIDNGIAGSTGSTGVQGWQGPIGLSITGNRSPGIVCLLAGRHVLAIFVVFTPLDQLTSDRSCWFCLRFCGCCLYYERQRVTSK